MEVCGGRPATATDEQIYNVSRCAERIESMCSLVIAKLYAIFRGNRVGSLVKSM